MAEAKLSGYKATAAACLTTELDSLADNSYTVLSSEIDNSTNLYMFADLEVYLASAAFTGTDSIINLYLVPSVDGTNYPSWNAGTADEQENDQYYIGSVVTDGTTAAQRMVLRNVALPNGKYKIGAQNKGGVALASSGNTVSWRPWQYKSV